MRIFKSLLGAILSLVFYLVVSTLIFWALELLQSLRLWAWFQGGEFYRTLSKILVGCHAAPSPGDSLIIYLQVVLEHT